MGKIKLILKAVGIGTAIALGNGSLATAEELTKSKQSLDSIKIKSFNLQFESDIFLSAEALSPSASYKSAKTIANGNKHLTTTYLTDVDALFGEDVPVLESLPAAKSQHSRMRSHSSRRQIAQTTPVEEGFSPTENLNLQENSQPQGLRESHFAAAKQRPPN